MSGQKKQRKKQPRKPKAHPWRAWNPGSLARGRDDADEMVIPTQHRLVKVVPA